MAALGAVLLLFSIIAWIIGLIKPGVIVRWGENRTRKMVSAYCGGLFVLSIILISASPSNETETTASVEEPTEEVSESTNEPQPSEVEPEKEMVEVAFDENISITNNKATINGTTNLADGALLYYEIRNDGNDQDRLDGNIEVSEGQFNGELDISGFSNGLISVELRFYPFQQDEELIALYGEAGEKMTGEKVSESETGKIIAANATYMKSVPIELSGSGAQATETFTLTSGFATFEATHDGGSNFVLDLLDANGNSMELLVNEIGSYNGKTFALIPSDGDYLLNIDADGSWNINISQAMSTNPESIPTTIQGSGDDVAFVDLESGLRRFGFKHTGESNFAVMVNGQSLLVNEIGNYEGSTAQKVNDTGTYILSIQADGDWSISIE